MANKKKREADSSFPQSAGTESMEPSSSISYASDVIATIAGLAASEVEGIAGMSNISGGLLSKNRNITRGIKVEVGTEEVSVDLFLTIEYGTPIQRASHDAQEAVKRSIESMTGMHVVRVDVHVVGVSFEKENNALQAGAGNAVLESGNPEYVKETMRIQEAAAPEKSDFPVSDEPLEEREAAFYKKAEALKDSETISEDKIFTETEASEAASLKETETAETAETEPAEGTGAEAEKEAIE